MCSFHTHSQCLSYCENAQHHVFLHVGIKPRDAVNAGIAFGFAEYVGGQNEWRKHAVVTISSEVCHWLTSSAVLVLSSCHLCALCQEARELKSRPLTPWPLGEGATPSPYEDYVPRGHAPPPRYPPPPGYSSVPGFCPDPPKKV